MGIAVVGAGCIGSFVGGRLKAIGEDVTFISRKQRSRFRLRLEEAGAEPREVVVEEYSTDARLLRNCDVVLVTVKTGATADVVNSIKEYVRAGTIILSIQNGLRNVDILNAGLQNCDVSVLAGMVSYNVVQLSDCDEQVTFRKTTKGLLVFEKPKEPPTAIRLEMLVSRLRKAKLEARTVDSQEIRRVQHCKLLLNLNNSTNAISLLPLREQLFHSGYRVITALAMAEALEVMHSCGIEYVPTAKNILPLPPVAIALVLLLPTPIFSVIAQKMLAVDPRATSSMQEDLRRGRATEVDDLNGYICRLAGTNDAAPLNNALIELIKAMEREAPGELRRKDEAEVFERLQSPILGIIPHSLLRWPGIGRASVAAVIALQAVARRLRGYAKST